MANNAERRLIKDLKKIQEEDSYESIMAIPDDDNLFQWTAMIQGPEDSEWEGGLFKLSMEFSEQYPNKAPKVKFVKNIPFHPNVYTDGNICLDTLMNNWSPVYDVLNILISI